MPHGSLMQHYDSLPTNTILSGISGFFALAMAQIDPLLTGIILPVGLFLTGKLIDVAVRIYIERKR